MSEAPAIRQLPTTVYDKMVFGEEPWRKNREGYREFPMAVPMKDGAPCFDPEVIRAPYDYTTKPPTLLPIVRVNSQEELDALKAGAELTVGPNETMLVKSPDDEKAELMFRAGQLGLKVDKRWGADRIRQAIADAEQPVV